MKFARELAKRIATAAGNATSPKQWNNRDAEDPAAKKRQREAIERTQMGRTTGEALFDRVCESHGLPIPEHEFQFAVGGGAGSACLHRGKLRCKKCSATRRGWMFDYLFDGWLALEVEGGMFGKGEPCPACHRRPVAGHTSIERLKDDMEKYNCAAVNGYVVVRCLPEDIDSGSAFELVKQALKSEGG